MMIVLLVISCSVLVVLAVLNGTAINLAWGDFPPELKSVLVVITFIFLWRLMKMATLNMNQIEDFSELGQAFYFKYDGRIYSIPPIPPYVAKKLFSTAKEFSEKSEERDKKLKEFEAKNSLLPEEERKPIPSELIAEAGGFFDFQRDFIILSGIIEVNEECNKINDVSIDDITGNPEKNIKGWSTKLVMRIFRTINEIISVEQEKKS